MNKAVNELCKMFETCSKVEGGKDTNEIPKSNPQVTKRTLRIKNIFFCQVNTSIVLFISSSDSWTMV